MSNNEVRVGVQATLDAKPVEAGLDQISARAKRTAVDVSKANTTSPGFGQKAADFLRDESKRAALIAAIRRDTDQTSRSMERSARAAREWMAAAKIRPSATDWESQAMARAFQHRQQHSPFMRGFQDVSAWSTGVASRFSSKADADRHIQDEIKRMSGLAFGGTGTTNIPYWQAMAGKYAGVAGGLIGGMVTGGGGLFGTMGAGAGSLLGLIPGAGKVLGPLAGASLGKVGSLVDQGNQDALGVATDVSALKHALGESSDSFDRLRARVQAASEGLAIAYTESSKFARQYAEISNLQRSDKDALQDELRTAYGMSRGFGGDPGAGVQFMAQMRLFGQVKDDKSAKILAVNIADALERGGNRSKMDEVLTAVSSFTQQAARFSLGSPDVLSFASMMATATASRTPGLDPAGAASLIGQVDQSLRRGGAYGQASQIAIMSALHNAHPGMSVFEIQALMQAGMFATPEKVFGPDSVLFKNAMSTGDMAQVARYRELASGAGARIRNIDPIMREARGYAVSNDEYFASVANMFGMSGAAHGSTLDAVLRKDPGFARLEGILAKSGISMDKLNPASLSGISQVAYTRDSKVLDSFAGKLFKGEGYKQASAQEKSEYAKAVATSFESAQAQIIKMLSERGREGNIGDDTLQVQTDLRDAYTRIGTETLGLTKDIKAGVLALVEKVAPESAVAREQRMLRETGARTQYLVDRRQQLEDRVAGAKTPFERRAALAELNRFAPTTGGGLLSKWAIEPSIPQPSEAELDPIFREAAKKYGVPLRELKAFARKESGMRNVVSAPNANGTVDRGIMQLNSAFDAERGIKNPMDPAENIFAGARLLRDLKNKNGGDLWKAARDYNGSGERAERYADDYMRRLAAEPADPYSVKVPDLQDAKSSAGQWTVMRGEAVVRLVDESGRDRGTATVPMLSKWQNGGRAMPAGSR